jgi:L-lactate dehydrogenase complex protein LldE
VKVALLVTCLADQLYPRVGVATVQLLRRLGCKVTFPEAQACCGQPALNSGYPDAARQAARVLLDAFESAEHVVAPSGSCVAMIRRHYPGLFAGDPARAARAQRLARKTYELSEFVVKVLGVTDVGACFPHRVTFHASCHGARLLEVLDEPLRLLGAVRELTLVPLPRERDCCGFGGTFSVKLADVSGAMVDEKAENVERSGASHLVGIDLGCLMNIAGRLQRRGSEIRALHLAELLNQGQEGTE